MNSNNNYRHGKLSSRKIKMNMYVQTILEMVSLLQGTQTLLNTV